MKPSLQSNPCAIGLGLLSGVILTTLTMASTARALELFVSQLGNDRNPGTRVEPLVFGPEDSGTASAPVNHAALPGAKVVISGGRCLDRKWKSGGKGILTVPASDPIDQLFVDGQRRHLARWPDYKKVVHGLDGGYSKGLIPKEGKLTLEEANQYQKKIQRDRRPRGGRRGAPRNFKVNPGWEKDSFPEHAVCYKSADEIKAIYANHVGEQKAVVSFDKPKDGAMRIVGTGHSFMAPGYKTFPLIAKAAGLKQPLYTHMGGGMTGSARYKWEEENGIFQFDRKPLPKLLASIANAKWEAMMWGPYLNDRPEFYSCWIDFCLKYHPDMKFFLSDAWPQLYQLDGQVPKSEDVFTEELFERLGRERTASYTGLVNRLRVKYGERIFIIPTSDAMVLAAKHQIRGELPGIEGIHKVVGKKERSLWTDHLGHLGPGLDRLEGYVFYATIYRRSPELIEEPIPFRDKGDFPSADLDRIFRKIAWEAVRNNPLSGFKE